MSIQQDFLDFHEVNPWVYDELVRLARRAKSRGRNHFGIKMIYEVVRWERYIQTSDPNDDSWKLNNNYSSRYARLIMEKESDLKDLFELRELRSL